MKRSQKHNNLDGVCMTFFFIFFFFFFLKTKHTKITPNPTPTPNTNTTPKGTSAQRTTTAQEAGRRKELHNFQASLCHPFPSPLT